MFDTNTWLNLVAAAACLLLAFIALSARTKSDVPPRFGALLVWLCQLYILDAMWATNGTSVGIQVAFVIMWIGLGTTSLRLGIALMHGRASWHRARTVTLIGVVAFLTGLELLEATAAIGLERPFYEGTTQWFRAIFPFVSAASTFGALVVIAPAFFAALDAPAHQRRSLALLSLGYTGLVAGAIGLLIEPRWGSWNTASIAIAARSAGLSAFSLLWFGFGIKIRDRFVIGMGVAMMTLFAMSAFVGVYGGTQTMYPIMRVLGLGLLTVAALTGQVEGLDQRLRFGISKSTLAAIFLAVFFVVSEGAAALFSDRLGQGLGIAAAGALVFGIAPLMRFADRFANAAVPSSQATNAEIFGHAVQAALADGEISAKEELHLAIVAEKLGLGPAETAAIRHAMPSPPES